MTREDWHNKKYISYNLRFNKECNLFKEIASV